MMKTCLLIIAIPAVVAMKLQAVTILSQDFDTDPVNYSGSAFQGSGTTYWTLSTAGITPATPLTGNATTYLTGCNMNSGGLPFTETAPAQIDFAVSVAAYTDLKLSLALAGSPMAETANFVRAKTDNDGDGTYETTIFNFLGNNNSAYTDSTLGALSLAFATFSNIALPTPTASDGLLRLRLELYNDSDSNNENAGMDNILITGTLVNYPTVVVTAPANGQKYPPGTSVDATATVGGGGTPPYTVKIYTNNAAMGTTFVQAGSDLTGSGTTFTMTLGFLEAGNYGIHATVTDSLSSPNISPTNAFSVVHARFWDTSTTSGLQAGDGIWDTETKWSVDTAGAALVSWLENSEAYFRTLGVNNVTLNGTVHAALLSVSGSGTVLNLSGGGALQITSGGTTIGSGSTLQIGAGGGTGSLDTPSVANTGTLVFNRTGALAYAGGISGPGVVRNLGSGTVTLTGTMGTASTPIGQVLLKQGATVMDASGQLYTQSSLYVGQASGDNASLTLKGNALLDTSNAAMGDSRIRVGDGGSTGLLTVQDTALVYSGFDRYLMTGAAGTIDVKGGNIAPWRVYFHAASTIIVEGGNLVSKANYDNLAHTARDGDWRSSGGAQISMTSGRLGGFNWSDMGLCTFNISGGLFLAGGNNNNNVGNGGVTTFNLTGGEVQWPSGRTIAGQASASVFNLGGTSLMDMRSITPGAGGVTFNFDGGTLMALVDNADTGFMPATVIANVKAGGAKIETAGYSVTVAAALQHDAGLGGTKDGGLTKLGLGTLTLGGNNSYTGPTKVQAGVLSCTSVSSLTPTALEIDASAQVDLAYSGNQDIPSLKIGGVSQTGGIYGSGALNPGGVFTGVGTVTVPSTGSPVSITSFTAGPLAGQFTISGSTLAAGNLVTEKSTNVAAPTWVSYQTNYGIPVGPFSFTIPKGPDPRAYFRLGIQ